jgi:hypothetical protein
MPSAASDLQASISFTSSRTTSARHMPPHHVYSSGINKLAVIEPAVADCMPQNADVDATTELQNTCQ